MELHPINLRTVPANPLIEFGREGHDYIKRYEDNYYTLKIVHELH
jgi:hypothetical protein